jgi:4-amino-4-deoxy-L-arabinose transferase-like glycosyltransferase
MLNSSESSNELGPRRSGQRPPWWNVGGIPLGVILLVALTFRCWDLDRTSLWYDEVITMRVARADNPSALIARLVRLDGTRAPLHPLLLQAWLRIFGSSDLAGRSFSVICGLVTVGVVSVLGRRAFDDRTGRWAAWLAAVCPPLVYYAREARMYAWLVLLTCLSWLALLSFRHTANKSQCLTYGLLLTALVYSHPVGLFMVAAHGLAYLLVRSALVLPLRWWLAIQLVVILAVVPWLGRYLDHGTDYPMPRYPPQTLLAVPIEYIGGNRIVLAVCLAIVGFGLVSWTPGDQPRRPSITNRTEDLILVTWAAAPPLGMYLYSFLFQPIFGPARYHLFIAPAYLVLVAHGLSKLSALIRWPAAAAGLMLSLSLIQAEAYPPGVKADWRGLAAWLKNQAENESRAGGAPRPVTVVVHPSDPRFPRDQVEAARYYLSPRFDVVLAGEPLRPTHSAQPRTIYEAYCLATPHRDGKAAPDALELYGLVVKKG